MDYYTILGMCCASIIALLTFGVAQKRSYKEDVKKDVREIQRLNENIIKLNSNFEHMLENLKVHDVRIGKHGEEIDILKDRVTEVEHKQVYYETKLISFENKLDEKK